MNTFQKVPIEICICSFNHLKIVNLSNFESIYIYKGIVNIFQTPNNYRILSFVKC